MCGIFGFTGVIDSDKKKVAHTLLAALFFRSETRGTHASGFSAMLGDKSVVFDKSPERGSLFAATSFKFKNLLDAMPTSFIGHTRYGTGSSPLINRNNHPFIGGRFNMVHNGTIPEWVAAGKRLGVYDSILSDTDSELILRAFEDKFSTSQDHAKSIEHLLNSIWGNMAVAFLDKETSEIWLYRNENPLYVFQFPDDLLGKNVAFFASTTQIFEDAIKDVKYFNVAKDVWPLKKLGIVQTMLKSNTAYTISPEQIYYAENKSSNFIESPIVVDKKFYREYAYFGYLEDNYTGRSVVTQPKKIFSKPVDVKKPELGCVLSVADAETCLKESDVSIDGFSKQDLEKVFDELFPLLEQIC